ncbi:MAG: hypothetical protein IKG46_06610 [Solobacterium sp.]|nr:hypothetical protein [Solobacterium sp.]
MDQKTLEQIKQIEAGDRALAKDFFEPLITELVPYVELFIDGEEEAMKYVRETINTGYKNIADAENAETVEEWIRGVARDVIVKKIGPVSVKRGSGSSEPVQKLCPQDPEECRKELLEMLKVLDPCERAAVVLNRYEHRSVPETAAILKTDSEITDTLLRHGRSRLDSLYLFELIEKLNPRQTGWDTLEIDQYLPKKEVRTDTYEFTTSIKSLDDTFIEETKSMKPISRREQRTYEESEERGNILVIRILMVLIILAALGLLWFVIRYLLR